MMPNEIMKAIGGALLMLAGATGYNALSCILRWQLGDVILGIIAGVLAYYLMIWGWRAMG